MTKEEKIKKLISVLENAKPVITKSSIVINFQFGFRQEVSITPTYNENEITFNNIDEAFDVIKQSENITNMTNSEMKTEFVRLCKEANVDPNNELVIRFLTT